MDLEKLNNGLESSPFYQFMQRHKKVINIFQGLIVIGLLISINIYVVKDHFIKKQIRNNCGYVDNNYKCICDKNYVDSWEALKNKNFSIGFIGGQNVSLV